VAMVVALSLPVLVLTIGGGADYARVLAARSKLQAAVDSATLATYKHYEQDTNQTEAQLQPYFDKALKASLRQKFERQIDITRERLRLDVANNTLRAEVSADFPTTFIRLAGIDPMTINTTSEVKASLNFTEVALVLDVTGSMGERGKLDELKQAARNFLDKINDKLPASSADSFKVAIVPFAEYVNVGTDKRNEPWIDVPRDRTIVKQTPWKDCDRWVCLKWGQETKRRCHWVGDPDSPDHHKECRDVVETVCQKSTYVKMDHCVTGVDTTRLNIKWEGCVGSRDYPLNLKDEGYGLERVPGVMNHPRHEDSLPDSDLDAWARRKRNHCSTPITPLMPLKTNIDQLKRKIDGLRARGYTYIPIGLVWGWRVLSHKEPFTEGARDADVKSKNVNKIIVLMTDGVNTRAPDKRSRRRYKYREHQRNDRAYADQMLRELCDNIKAINPVTDRRNAEIITVTFDVTDNNIKNLLKSCSTMGSFDAQSGQLTEVFENIANSLAELHLSR
jgi:Flp pilus assembly protein TadG